MSKRESKQRIRGLPATEWLPIFRAAKVEVDRLDSAKSTQARATIIGNFLARMVNRQVPIEVNGQGGMATLRKLSCRARQQLYYFEIVFDDGEAVLAKSNSVDRKKRTEAKQKPGASQSAAQEKPKDPGRTKNPSQFGNQESW